MINHLLLKTMGCLYGCLVSSASVQKLFCGIFSAFQWSFDDFVGKKVVSPSYSSTISGPPHRVNWLLARLLSPFLTPPLLLLVTSIYLLPLLFSMKLCEPLWVSLTVENLFTINLDVLSSVLYGWRSLEATVSIRLKARGRGLKSQTWEHQKTPDSREY